jgi:hypothetical protein
MIPYLLAAVGGYLIGDSMKDSQTFADGGMANGGITVIESSPRSEYEDYEMLVISKDAEKDGGGFHKHRYLVSAKNIQEAKEIATRMFEEDSCLSDYYFYEVMSEERYRMFYMDKFAKGGVVGDSARVKSKNKTGVIMKVFKADDFEQFSDIKPEKHYLIKFVDGTQDTYAKSELEFYAEKFADGGILDFSKVSNVVVEGIDYDDYPDFSDAYIVEADYDGIPMTEEQLEELNENSEFVHESVFEQIN